MTTIQSSTHSSSAPHNSALSVAQRAKPDVPGTTLPERKPRFHLYTPEEIAEFPDPGWLIEDILRDGSFSLLYGPPGVGKSFVGLDMALCIATGTPWQGRAVVQGPVVYVVGEGQSGIKDRLAAWQKTHGAIREFRVVFSPVQLDDANEINAFFASIEEAAITPHLCVFDTLARCAAGMDENSSSAMSEIVDAVTRIARERSVNVLLIHHSGRKGSNPRGHSVLDGATDTMIFCDRKTNAFSLRCTKQKDGEYFDEIGLKLDKVDGGSCVVVASDLGSGTPSRSQVALEALQRLGGRRTGQEWRFASGLKGSTFSKAKSDLLGAGRVAQDGKHYFLSAPPAEMLPETSAQTFLSIPPFRGGGENGEKGNEGVS